MNQVKKQKLSTIKALHFNNQSYTKLDEIWQALHQSFNLAQNCQININVLNKLLPKLITEWNPFSKEEFKIIRSMCNNSSTPELDRVLQKYLKYIINDNSCLSVIINITNAYINLGYWPSYFKMSLSIIIPKPNKIFYNSPKSFCSIILLNMLEKLIEKVIGEGMQYHAIVNNFFILINLENLSNDLLLMQITSKLI